MSDGDEMVWIALNAASSSSESYHTRECIHCPPEDGRTERRRAVLEAWGYSECAYCARSHPLVHSDDDDEREQRDSLRARVGDPEDAIQELMSDD